MKLKSVKIRNFRGYKNETTIEFNELTAFIGKNDAGKSTILEALEIFFNNSTVVCEREDLSVDATDTNIEITCTFEDLPGIITLDTSSETTLHNEFLLNLNNELEIKKVFSATAAKPKSKTYIICNHPTAEGYNNLLELKRAELKKIARQLNIDSSEYNASNNASMRKRIWEHSDNLNLQLRELIVDKEDSKKIYESLEQFLPLYSLFQSDRSSKDDDKEVTDPMKIAIQQALRDLTPEIEKIKEEVQKRALETAERTLAKLKEMDSELASSLTPDFKSEPKFDSLFKLSIQSDQGISINKRGSGVRRLILLNFFRAEVERRINESSSKNVIFAFEEPETSQHPKHQEMLINSFLQLAFNTNSQVVLTTHTPALAGLLPLESLRFVTKENGVRLVKSQDESVYEEISNALGLLPDPISKSTRAVLLLEGQGDVIFIRHLCNKLKEGGVIPSTLEESGFAFIPTGGCGNLKAWKTLKLVDQFNVPWCVLLDSDNPTPEAQKNIDTQLHLHQTGIKAYLTRKREPENYIHRDCFGVEFEYSDLDDVKVIANQHTSVAKGKILEHFWPKMTFEQIREMEQYTLEGGLIHYEFTEMITDFLSLVKQPALN
ncbi:AAA family ATPase [Bacillus sp. ISL-4]|uniref:AAA family ATPase n=1 Tax=Bacillus sp. ISL-4 TaxID=2819125 RepID=UPI001BEBEA85|nr:AAA family ATPase [Bacillus sp. ISL-4]MBT2666146.1 AAA family ATPase [Bacillus sp. ISL-4]MBT2670184.1 AAA family ATPase [Streptomyces sp. ISL-14]